MNFKEDICCRSQSLGSISSRISEGKPSLAVPSLWNNVPREMGVVISLILFWDVKKTLALRIVWKDTLFLEKWCCMYDYKTVIIYCGFCFFV